MTSRNKTPRSFLTRRALLRSSGVALIGGTLGCHAVEHMRPEVFSHQPSPFELEEFTLSELQDQMQRGGWSARTVAEAYLSRIEEMNRRGPTLRAIIETNPDALSIADELDAERTKRGPRGPLHGIPVLLKDNIDTVDRMTTTAGSLALSGSTARFDADVAQRLRAAGAVLLGKTNLSEWANFRSTRSSSGWSARGGQCRNPYALDRSPGGSSSGSAVAVAANLALVAIGTETDGSIVSPASINGVVGIKPTVGLVSQTGIVPIAKSQDTAGPIARTVRDAALTLAAISNTTPRQRDSSRKIFDPDGLRGARVGVARRFFGFHSIADEVAEAALQTIRDAGGVVIDPVGWPSTPLWDQVETEVLLYEFKNGLNAYLRERRPDAGVQSLRDVIAFNQEHRDQEMAFFGQELFHLAAEKGPLSEPRYLAALALNQRLAREDGIDRVMDRDRLDAIVAPTRGPAWMIDLINGDQRSGSSARPAAAAGYPHVTVPAGDGFGLPVGFSFFGRAWSEPVLIRLAFAFEQMTEHRQVPRFLKTASLPSQG